jgi:PcfJ-like protein
MPLKIAPREHAKALIDRSIRKALARTYGKPRKSFLQMLGEVRGRSDLLRPARLRGRIEVAWLDTILDGLRALTEHRKDWLRPLDTWRPVGSNPIPLFSSLAHHLLADFPVPPVLVSAWFRGDGFQARQQQRWFKRAGKGISLRTVGFPIALTRRMAHEFAHAPAHYHADFALRWAQVRGLGGPDKLARAVAATRLGREFRHDEFWVSVLHFFINHPKFDLIHVDPIVEFLHAQKFAFRRAIIGQDTEIYIDPPQPDLSLKGWSEASLLRRVEEWKARGKVEAVRELIRWDRSGIGELVACDEQGRDWTIRELLDSDALVAEGQAMDHCAATYTLWCAKRLTTIWSVGIERPEGRERVATVEVDPATRGIVQAKARSNDEPDESCLAIIRQWASQEALKPER